MQTAIISGILAVSFYLAALILQAMTVFTRRNRNSKVFLFGALAVLFHGFNVYGVIRANDGYQFGFFEISTLIAFSISSFLQRSACTQIAVCLVLFISLQSFFAGEEDLL